jgi:CubicO group peptidase (beta-lactamase class C family)
MKTFIATFITFTTLLLNSFGQVASKNDTIQRINNYLTELDKVGFNGSVLVELNGRKILSKGYGFSNKEQQIKNSSSTVFDIGSVTKQFTAAAILKLEMQGKLSTNDSIARYFDDVPNDKQGITIHDLLRHQSGLVSNVGGDYEKISETEFLQKVFSSSLRFERGKSFSYSNIGYSLLAMIIEKVSGKSYETYLYENLWKPAQMEMTGYTRPRFDTSLIAVGYTNDSIWGKPTDQAWDKTAPYLHLKGNGGILSTTEDMYKWHRALMTDNILSSEAKQKIYHPKLRPEEEESNYYAYGWFVQKTPRKTNQVMHNGTNHIFYADIIRFIDEGIVLIMLSNKAHPGFNGLTFDLIKIIFNPNYTPEIPQEDNNANRNFTEQLIKVIEVSGLETAKKEYQERNKDVKLLEFLMRNEGFNHIDNNQPEVALQIFEMNVFAYPNSAKALQGLAEGYFETGNKELALKYFKQSLSINPDNPFVMRMMKQIEEEK